MSLTQIVVFISIAAAVFTGVTYYTKNVKNLFISFLQSFCGIWFIFSGSVKLVDPLGLAFKMDQYFSEFAYTFSASQFKFIAPLFTSLGHYTHILSVLVIVAEVMIGLMLLFGIKPKLTAWLFFAIMVFFTFLTGYTHLTGYVPEGINFFDFGKWSDFDTKNMKVTDCGCFGDFLKLEPTVSFYKDLFLMIPAILFLMYHRFFHRFFSSNTRLGISLIGLLLTTMYALNNTYWNEPAIDFRPFKIGTNIKEKRKIEMDAIANIPIFLKITPIAGGTPITLTQSEYGKRYAEFPKESFNIEQVKGASDVERTKLSDFIIYDKYNSDVTNDLLEDSSLVLMVVEYKVDMITQDVIVESQDTVFADQDTVNADKSGDSNSIVSISTVSETVQKQLLSKKELELYNSKILPLLTACQKAKIRSMVVYGGINAETVEGFKGQLNAEFDSFEADDILLKTIIRSNPGFVLWKNGTILGKWHINNPPSIADIQSYK